MVTFGQPSSSNRTSDYLKNRPIDMKLLRLDSPGNISNEIANLKMNSSFGSPESKKAKNKNGNFGFKIKPSVVKRSDARTMTL